MEGKKRIVEKKVERLLLILSRKYEPRVLECLYARKDNPSESARIEGAGWVQYSTILENCAEPSHNSSISKALNNLKSFGLIKGQGKKGRDGYYWKVDTERYDKIIELTNQLNTIING